MEPRELDMTGHDSVHDFDPEESLALDVTPQQIEAVNDRISIDEALMIAADWMEASGSHRISQKVYQRLYEAGYASDPASRIKGLFNGWDNLQQDSKAYYAERCSRQAAEQAQLLDAISGQYKKGLLPDELFLKARHFYVDNPTPGKKKLPRYELTDEPAEPNEIITRYYKYILVNQLTWDRFDEEPVNEARRTSIALGFSPGTGKPLASFYGSIKASNGKLQDEEYHHEIERLGAQKYLYADDRAAHLEALLRTGSESARQVEIELPAEPEFYKEIEFAFPRETNEIYYDTQRRIIVLGSLALKAAGGENLRLLSELLTDDGFDPGKANKHAFKEWSKDDCRHYGEFLLRVLDATDQELTFEVLEKAARLNLGPGYRALASRYSDSLINFYDDLGIEKPNSRGAFEDMTFNDVVRYVQKVALLNGGRVTEPILRNHYQRMKKLGVSVMSPSVIKSISGGKISTAIEAAGFEVTAKKTDANEIIESCIRFFDETGRIPTVPDFRDKAAPYLSSWPTVRRYLKNVDTLVAAVQERLDGRDAVFDQLAA